MIQKLKMSKKPKKGYLFDYGRFMLCKGLIGSVVQLAKTFEKSNTIFERNTISLM